MLACCPILRYRHFPTHFSKVLITLRAQSYSLKSESVEWWCSYKPASPSPICLMNSEFYSKTNKI